MEELRQALATATTQRELNSVQMKAYNAFHKGELTPVEFGEISGEVKEKFAVTNEEGSTVTNTADKAKNVANALVEKVASVAISEEDIAAAIRGRDLGASAPIVGANFVRGFFEGLVRTPGTLMLSRQALREIAAKTQAEIDKK